MDNPECNANFMIYQSWLRLCISLKDFAFLRAKKKNENSRTCTTFGSCFLSGGVHQHSGWSFNPASTNTFKTDNLPTLCSLSLKLWPILWPHDTWPRCRLSHKTSINDVSVKCWWFFADISAMQRPNIDQLSVNNCSHWVLAVISMGIRYTLHYF